MKIQGELLSEVTVIDAGRIAYIPRPFI